MNKKDWTKYDKIIGKNYEPPKEKSNFDTMREALKKQFESGYDAGYEFALKRIENIFKNGEFFNNCDNCFCSDCCPLEVVDQLRKEIHKGGKQ